jgi:pimeloyl-ACP methyl ester carboxylesterase
MPLDTTVLTEEDYHKYASSLQRNGFFGPDSWYMNGARNIEYAKRWPTRGKLEMPVLFLHATYDYVCMTVGTRLADPMRASCSDLTEVTVKSGHWMAQEKPLEVNAHIVRWLARQFPQLWPQ